MYCCMLNVALLYVTCCLTSDCTRDFMKCCMLHVALCFSVKERLHMLMRSPHDFTEQSFKDLAPTEAEPIVAAMKKVGNPRAMCEKVYKLIQSLLEQIKMYAEGERNRKWVWQSENLGEGDPHKWACQSERPLAWKVWGRETPISGRVSQRDL